MNILSIDLGSKKTGVAIAREQSSIAEVLPTIFESGEQKLISKLNLLIQENKIELILIGAPFGPNREENTQVKHVVEFANKLKSISGINFKLLDESLTSKKAEEMNKNNSDSIAAAILLQEFLNSENP